MEPFTLTSTVKDFPAAPYRTIKEAILGARYQLSLTFVGPARAAQLNRTYRQKTYTPNVLSFPLTAHAGEIFICPPVAKREAAAHQLSYEAFTVYLFIHGCLHLKGYDHGDTMEKLERRYMHRFTAANHSKRT